MVLAVLSVDFVLLDFALFDDVVEGADTAVSIVDDALELHGQVGLRCQFLALLLHVHCDRHETLFSLHLVDLAGLDARIIDLLAHLRLELETAKLDDFLGLLHESHFVVAEALLELLDPPIERVLMILHLLGQVVQLVNLDLDIEAQAHLVLILGLQGEQLAVGLLAFLGLNLFLVGDFLVQPLHLAEFHLVFLDRLVHLLLVLAELCLDTVDLVDLVLHQLLPDHLKVARTAVL